MELAILVVEVEVLRVELTGLREESVGLVAGIVADAAGFAVVLATDTNNLLGEPAPIHLSGYDVLVGNTVSPHQQHVE